MKHKLFWAKKQCEKYLATKGMKRDKCFCCCDDADKYGCKYRKTVFITDDGEWMGMK